MTKQKTGVFDVVNCLIMAGLIIVTLYPLLYVLFASFSDPQQFVEHEGALLLKPLGFTWIGYKMMFRDNMIVKSMFNTLFVVGASLVLQMTMTAITAYFLSRKDLLFKKVLFIMIVITMYINGGLVPQYLIIKAYGLYDSLWALIFAGAINTFNVIVLKSNFESIPDSLLESAMVDGAKHISILFRIVIPLSKASLAVILLYYAVANWNSWFPAMIFLNTREKFPLQLILRQILIVNETSEMTTGMGAAERSFVNETIKYATIIFSTMPIIIVYPFLQRYFVKGVMVGAVKG